MDSILVKKSHRRTIRRAVRSDCTAFTANEYREIGTEAFDLSTQGMLVACDQPVEIGDPIALFFKAPGVDELWLDAEAEVTRIVRGMRRYDRGTCMGVRFTYIEKPDRKHLLNRLVGYPPPIPKRRPRVDYAETVRRIMQNRPMPPTKPQPHRLPFGAGFNRFMSQLKTKIELRSNRDELLEHLSLIS